MLTGIGQQRHNAWHVVLPPATHAFDRVQVPAVEMATPANAMQVNARFRALPLDARCRSNACRVVSGLFPCDLMPQRIDAGIANLNFALNGDLLVLGYK